MSVFEECIAGASNDPTFLYIRYPSVPTSPVFGDTASIYLQMTDAGYTKDCMIEYNPTTIVEGKTIDGHYTTGDGFSEACTSPAAKIDVGSNSDSFMNKSIPSW